MTRNSSFVLLALFVLPMFVIGTLSAAPKSRWKVEIAKTKSIVTGSRDVFVSTTAIKSKSMLVVGCKDGKVRLLLGETFRIQNGVSNTLTKSDLQRQVEGAGPQTETFGFAFSVDADNKWRSQVKFRLEGETEFFDGDVPLGWQAGTYTLILDELAESVIPRLRDHGKLYVQLPYKSGAKDVTYELDGMEAAKEIARANGCPIP